MDWKDSVRKNLSWLIGIFVTLLAFVLAEGWLMLFAKALGPVRAAILIIFISTSLSWLVIYFLTRFGKSRFLGSWFSKREKSLSKRAEMAVKSGKFIVVLNSTVFLGPILTSVLMLILGLKGRKVYVYAACSAVFFALTRCGFYSGAFWGFDKILLWRR